MIACLLLTVCLGIVASQSVAPDVSTTPRMHYEKPETDSITFHFDSVTRMLLVLSGNKCYIWSITNNEHNNIHTDDGLRAVELRVLKEIDDAFFTVVTPQILSPSIKQHCRYADHYYLVH
ncbi:uncharacterized protein LOC128213057 [Mya arenaria]|uniref:uncharacterized protein LOC128213057 n=1 Tax=Mya arenaria TaxID=6604 RepID=UPI0022E09170|nr:uncharacterized protein LOC128213057 [Mya arenaria]